MVPGTLPAQLRFPPAHRQRRAPPDHRHDGASSRPRVAASGPRCHVGGEDVVGAHESGLLFTTDLGNFVGTSTIHNAWRIAAKKVPTDATPHDLRHYFASVQIRGGQSIKVLQALLGHKSAVETWDTYGHLMGDEDTRSRAIVDELLGRDQIPQSATRADQ